MAKKQVGGRRKGAGRKPLDTEGVVTVALAIPVGMLERLDSTAAQCDMNRSQAIREAIHMLTTEQIRDTAIQYMQSQLQAAGWKIFRTEYRSRGVGFLAAERDGVRCLFQTTAQFDTDHQVQQDVSDIRHDLMNESGCETLDVAAVTITAKGDITEQGIAEVQRVIQKKGSPPLTNQPPREVKARRIPKS